MVSTTIYLWPDNVKPFQCSSQKLPKKSHLVYVRMRITWYLMRFYARPVGSDSNVPSVSWLVILRGFLVGQFVQTGTSRISEDLNVIVALYIPQAIVCQYHQRLANLPSHRIYETDTITQSNQTVSPQSCPTKNSTTSRTLSTGTTVVTMITL